MKRVIVLLTALATALAIAMPAVGARSDDQSADNDYLIVTLTGEGAPYDNTASTNGRFDPNSQGYARIQDRMQRQHERFATRLARVAPEAEIVNEFFVTANALTVKLNGADPAAIGSINGVNSTQRSNLYTLDMDQSVGLIDALPAWAEVGGREDAGDGIRIGVIDSGIVNSLIPGFHPFFNCKTVEFGGIFYSGETGTPAIGIRNENGAEPAPGAAFVSPHGTHVGGTAGGCIYTIDDVESIWDTTTLSGVAPGATLVDYNVFPGIGAGWTAFGGSAFSHDIADAIETSVANGDHVINMSLGGGVQGPHDFLAEVSNGAVAAGVVVVTSAGNEGPDAYTVGSPGSAEDVITVGATTNTRGMGAFINAPGFDTIKAYPGEFADFDGTVDYTVVDWPGSDNLACDSDVADGALSGEVVMIERGECTFTQKVTNAELAGAGGVIVYTDDRDPGGMAQSPGDTTTIPAVMVARDDGLALEAATPLSPVNITEPQIVAETPNELAAFSSRGPVPFTGIVKPDVVAPGVNILSSVFFGFELFNGTSMASPHVAGASAVLLDANPSWTPAQVKSALATTATDLGLAPWEQGSGLIDLDAALATNAFFSPTNASFGTFTGKAPANGSIDIQIDSGESCSVVSTTGSHVDAEVSGETLTVDFNGGRTAASGNHGGYVSVDCGSQTHTIPWGTVIDR